MYSLQDPVKYPDNMSSNFKSFLQGLLNKVKFAIVDICVITFSFSP